MFKKILSSFLVISFGCSASITSVLAAEIEQRTFIATAYYSPLPGQSVYLRGSYEADCKLNGNGTNGASGKPVYPGMIAAPKTYAFGTQIVIPGLGTGSVEDRGGAIVKAGERGHAYDRIDIWMGQGEAGLKRALNWGKRTISAVLIPKEHVKDASYITLPKVPAMELAAYRSDELSRISGAPTPVVSDIFSQTIGVNSSSGSIRKLSEVLVKLGYLNTVPTGNFTPDMKIAIIHFQIDQKLIDSATDKNAGNYGPLTRKQLKEAYALYEKETSGITQELANLESSLQLAVTTTGKEIAKTQELLAGTRVMSIGETSQQVRSLQEMLLKLGYYHEKTTGIFGEKTRDALVAFQIEHKLVLSKQDPNAGKFGSVTKTKMIAALLEKEDTKKAE